MGSWFEHGDSAEISPLPDPIAVPVTAALTGFGATLLIWLDGTISHACSEACPPPHPAEQFVPLAFLLSIAALIATPPFASSATPMSSAIRRGAFLAIAAGGIGAIAVFNEVTTADPRAWPIPIIAADVVAISLATFRLLIDRREGVRFRWGPPAVVAEAERDRLSRSRVDAGGAFTGTVGAMFVTAAATSEASNNQRPGQWTAWATIGTWLVLIVAASERFERPVDRRIALTCLAAFGVAGS